MKENQTIIPLKLRLPRDYPFRVGLVGLVQEFYKNVHRDLRFDLPRFIGYYISQSQPYALTSHIRVALPLVHPISVLQASVKQDVQNKGAYPIWTMGHEANPMYMLIHDLWDESCTVMSFEMADRFVTAGSPLTVEEEKEY